MYIYLYIYLIISLCDLYKQSLELHAPIYLIKPLIPSSSARDKQLPLNKPSKNEQIQTINSVLYYSHLLLKSHQHLHTNNNIHFLSPHETMQELVYHLFILSLLRSRFILIFAEHKQILPLPTSSCSYSIDSHSSLYLNRIDSQFFCCKFKTIHNNNKHYPQLLRLRRIKRQAMGCIQLTKIERDCCAFFQGRRMRRLGHVQLRC